MLFAIPFYVLASRGHPLWFILLIAAISIAIRAIIFSANRDREFRKLGISAREYNLGLMAFNAKPIANVVDRFLREFGRLPKADKGDDVLKLRGILPEGIDFRVRDQTILLYLASNEFRATGEEWRLSNIRGKPKAYTLTCDLPPDDRIVYESKEGQGQWFYRDADDGNLRPFVHRPEDLQLRSARQSDSWLIRWLSRTG